MQKHSVRIKSRKWLSKNSFELCLKKPGEFKFKPGQRITINLKGLKRDYTPVSSPGENELKLLIRKVTEGNLSVTLSELEPGKMLEFRGPHGYFVYRSSDRQPVFVATGTGLAPFVSMAKSGISDFVLLHGVKTSEELYYQNSMKRAALEYIPCISRTEKSERYDFYYGRVTDYIKEKISGNKYDFYLCGNSNMLRDVTVLIDKLFPDSRVFSERFY